MNEQPIDESLIDEDLVLHQNGRRTDRTPAELQVRVTTNGEEPKTFLTKDISAYGLFIRTADPLAPGTRVRLLFALPRSAMMNIDAEVAWNTREQRHSEISQSGMGVRFTRIPPAAEAILRAYFR